MAAATAANMKRMDDLIADLDRSLSEFAHDDPNHPVNDVADGFDLLDSYNDDSTSAGSTVVGDELLRFEREPPAIHAPTPMHSVTQAMPRPPSNPIYRTASPPQFVGVPMPSYAVEEPPRIRLPVLRTALNSQSTNMRMESARAVTAAGYAAQLQQFQREYPGRKNSLASAATLSTNSDHNSGLSFYGVASPGAGAGNGVPFAAQPQPPLAGGGRGIAMGFSASVAGSFASDGEAINADGEIRALRLELERAKLELIDQMQMNKILLQNTSAAQVMVPDSVFRSASIPASSVGTPSQPPKASEDVESIKSDTRSEGKSDIKSEKSAKSTATGWFGARSKSVEKDARTKRREEKRAIETKKKEVINLPMMMEGESSALREDSVLVLDDDADVPTIKVATMEVTTDVEPGVTPAVSQIGTSPPSSSPPLQFPTVIITPQIALTTADALGLRHPLHSYLCRKRGRILAKHLEILKRNSLLLNVVQRAVSQQKAATPESSQMLDTGQQMVEPRYDQQSIKQENRRQMRKESFAALTGSSKSLAEFLAVNVAVIWYNDRADTHQPGQ
ncbi:hypothetical protein HDU82_008596 [Entophlyctis luteolus]|nr:hypothetical protein HDU82_008596 [Entophlyctis luteolus]